MIPTLCFFSSRLHQTLANLGRSLLLLRVEPLTDLGLGSGGGNEAQPVAAREAGGVGHDLDDVAILELTAQRLELAVDPRTDTVVPQIGVDLVGEVQWRGAARETSTRHPSA